MWRLSVVLLCLAIPSLPQALTFGAKGGVRLTDDYRPHYVPFYPISNSRRYLVGPMIEVGLPFHFGFEADALYSRLGNTIYYPFVANAFDIRTIANSWQFPLLAKYHLPIHRPPLFVSMGFAPRHTDGAMHTIHYGFYPSDIAFFSKDWDAHDRALVLGGGIDVKLGHVRISPDIRYVRWHVPSSPSPSDTAYYLQTAHSYEVQLLVGIGWARS